MKDVMKAILIRALCVIAAAAIVATYAKIMVEVRDRKDRKAVEEQKAKAKVSMTTVSELLDALRTEIVDSQEQYLAANTIEREGIMLNLTSKYVNKCTVFHNGSVRDIYLSSVQNMVRHGFVTKA